MLSEAARGTPNVSLTQSAPVLRARQAEVQKAESKKSLLRNTQGVHMAMRLNMEQTILSQYRRLPGFHSEFMGLEIMQDNMTHVGVHDILNDPTHPGHASFVSCAKQLEDLFHPNTQCLMTFRDAKRDGRSFTLGDFVDKFSYSALSLSLSRTPKTKKY